MSVKMKHSEKKSHQNFIGNVAVKISYKRFDFCNPDNVFFGIICSTLMIE